MSSSAPRRSVSTRRLERALNAAGFDIEGSDRPTIERAIPAITRFAGRLARQTVDEATARDIAQAAAVTIWSRLRAGRPFSSGSDPVRIASGIVRKMLLRHRRDETHRRPREQLYMDERVASVHVWMDPEARVAEAEIEELRGRVCGTIGHLRWTVLILCCEEGLSYRQVAQRLNKSVSTIRQLLVRARAVYREECRAMDIPAPPPRRSTARSRAPDRTRPSGAGR